MIKQLSKKSNKLMLLGAAVVVMGLGFGSQNVKADSPADDQSSNYQNQLNEHKNLQAYTHPLIAAELNTAIGSVPSAQDGISNWNSLPAGTTAKWNMEPDVNKAGRSYGQVIVTFPDGSQSPLAVYVNTKESKDDTSESPVNSETIQDNDSQTSESQNQDLNTSNVSDKEDNSVKTNTTSETTSPKSQAAVINNETAHVAGDTTLPQTNKKSEIIALITGLMMISISLFGMVKSLVKVRN